MKYISDAVPADYFCSKCLVSGCKLWRQYNTLASHIQLMCCDCAAKHEKVNISDMDANGKYTSSITETKIDQIGWLVPAVPDEEEETYWGYTAVPPAGVLWWKGLPTRALKERR